MLRQGRAAYDGLEYEKAVEILEEALGNENITAGQKTDIYLYLGLCQASLGHREQAKRAFSQLLPPLRSPHAENKLMECRLLKTSALIPLSSRRPCNVPIKRS